ncbi:MAG: metal ABC transporter permease, partial [Candidatus Korarchaeum sp.]|nr:metal ABC transporter permease [Candidatus Korarchaeum sp.]MDW8036235.1 metal ABC transporter permease [Candidatus Korarchaeum sp.]
MQFELFLDIRWFLVISLSSMVFGVVSPLVLSRRLLFLAGSLPHSALMSALLAIILNRVLSVPYQLMSLTLSVILVLAVFYMISMGLRPDVATAIFLSLTVSLTALSLYYVMTSFPVRESIWSYLVGDPLLVTWEDVHYTAMTSLSVLGLSVPFLKNQAFIGAD